MNWQEALNEIHSVEFDVNLNVVSSTDAFYDAVAREPAVLDAYALMREFGYLPEEVMGRLSNLVWTDTDHKYENPNDTPLAVLLWLTYFSANDLASIAASWVEQAPRCWHAKKLAHRILNPPPSTTRNPLVWGEPYEQEFQMTSPRDLNYTWDRVSMVPTKVFVAYPAMKPSTTSTTWPIQFGKSVTGKETREGCLGNS